MNTLTGTHKVIVLLAMMFMVTILEVVALLLGFNGQLLTTVVTGLFAVPVYLFGRGQGQKAVRSAAAAPVVGREGESG